MAVSYPDILITMQKIWQQTSTPAGGGPGDLSFSDLYLNYFAMLFRPKAPHSSTKEDPWEMLEKRISKIEGEQREQLTDLRTFCLSMMSACRSKYISPEDIYDWLCDFLQNATPERVEQFRTKSCLVNEIRKYYSQKRNPDGYEFTGKLCDALHALVASGEIEVRSLGPNRKIQKETSFKLKTAPERNAIMPDYEAKRDTIPNFRTRIRGGGVENSAIITEKAASELSMKLLAAFNGWTRFADLLDAAWNHVPKTLKLVPEDESLEPGDTSSDPSEKAAESLDRIIVSVSAEKSETIWCEILRVTREEFFCLYILPAKLKAEQHRLEDFGPPGTMSEQNKKVWTILTKELRYITVRHGRTVDLDSRDPSDENLYEEDAEKVVRTVFRNLNHKCTDHGYDTGLNLND